MVSPGSVASHLKIGLVNPLQLSKRFPAREVMHLYIQWIPEAKLNKPVLVKNYKSTQRGSSQDIPFSFQDFQNPNYQQYQNYQSYQNYQQNQNYPQQYFPVQQSYNTFKLLEENQSYNPRNQFSQRVPETQFQSSQPENFQFRDAQNEESDSFSDDPAPERIEEETSEELHPVAEKKHNYKLRQKRKNWVEREELALARAYVNVSKDKQRGNQQRFDAFWERVLEHFSVQMGGSDRSRHQVNSKWKDLQKKCNAFNCIYNRKMNSVASGRSEADVLQSSLSEYRRTINQKGFPHQQAWEWLKDNAKWAFVTKVGEDSPPPSSKRTKTSSSNAYTSSSDPQYPPIFSPQQQQSFSVEDSPPQRKRKGKKATSTSSTENEMFGLVKQIVGIKTATETEAEQRQRYREQKLRILEANEERKAQLLDREIENQDMEYFLRPHDHLTGCILRTVLERKRQIATKYGWELENP
ncbi:glutathione S-transferase T3-like [Lactuca sativa]|uniref:glutathione S-transferase T3-like n=1 Tax=Lactuca sativa TaxID=4236 RepID=UPI000CD86DD3|nr:glutathione S-transferase T3-like [Lactuca sativa]